MFILIAIIAFAILILVHELGHFLAAKACGVRVLEFSLGMGPTLLKKQGKETLYSLRALPFGGFCAMEGEDEESDDPRAFSSQKPWKKVIILCAGAAMNFLFGVLLILCIASHWNVQEPVIGSFMEGCPYESVEGLQVGDRFYKIDGRRTYFSHNVKEYFARNETNIYDLVLIRDGKKVVLEDYYMPPVEYEQPDGSVKEYVGITFAPRVPGLWSNLRCAWFGALDFVRLVWQSLGDLVTGGVGLKDLSGPVGIVDFVNDVATEAESTGAALFNVCYIFALIAVNLAVMNLLPLPALDGGRVFLLLVTWVIEKLTRRKLDPKYEGYIHSAGFVLLMGLMVVVLFNDVMKIIF